MPVCKSLGGSLYEVRSNLKDCAIAQVFFSIKGSLMVLLHGFIKKSQKAPNKELDLALRRLKEVSKNEGY